VGGMVVFLHGREFGLPVAVTGMIVIGVVMAGMVMASVLVLGMIMRVVGRLVRGGCV
jgi:hypothetical protein